MAKGEYKFLDGVLKRIKVDLDVRDEKTNVVAIYAHNGSGKTRLSKLFQDKYEKQQLCYNAFVEDYFYWDNENSIFKIRPSWVLDFIEEQGLNTRIAENFEDFIGIKINADINTHTGDILFKIPQEQNNIKISRGEESIFVWTVFYCILEMAIYELNEEEENRSTNIFDKIKYIIIDDPVSSLDDTRIITVALKILNLIKQSKNGLSFLITTHHPLFFNVLFTKKSNKMNKTNYILSKSNNNNNFKLKKQGGESPFAYHHVAMDEIKKAIKKGQLQKYHFNLFRCLLEKTANFLGYAHWKDCLNSFDLEDDFLKLIDHYSHDRLSDLEYNNLIESHMETFEETFDKFCNKYNWSYAND